MNDRMILEMEQILKDAEGLSSKDMKNAIPKRLKKMEKKGSIERGLIEIHQSVLDEGIKNGGLTYLPEKSAYNDFFMISGTQYALIRITSECYKVVDGDLVDSLAAHRWKYDAKIREPYSYMRIAGGCKKVYLAKFVKYMKSGNDHEVFEKGMEAHHKWFRWCEIHDFMHMMTSDFHQQAHNQLISRQRMSGLYRVGSWDDLLFIIREVQRLAPVMRKTWLTARF